MHSTYVRMAMDRQRAQEKRRNLIRQPYHVAIGSKVRDCCRKTIAFLFTQIGVIGLIVAYTVAGAFIFIALESKSNQRLWQEGHEMRSRCVDLLWNITHHLNVLHYDRWRQDVDKTLLQYQHQVVRHVRRGYDATERIDSGWNFPAALMYCITVFTTIGYGNLTPKTPLGKLATVFYALLGIPLMLLYMTNVGEILATSFKYTYNKMCRCQRRPLDSGSDVSSSRKVKNMADAECGPEATSGSDRQMAFRDKRKRKKGNTSAPESHPDDPETVSVTSCLLVMLIFVLGGAILFGAWEGWGYVDGSYFCFTSLLTIGFGDFVPGQTIYRQVDHSAKGFQTAAATNLDVTNGQDQSGTNGRPYNYQVDTKLILCAVYLLLGMALLAMCVNLMQEEVIMKIKRFGRRVGLLRQRN